MARRLYIPNLRGGELRLNAGQSHHARDVLRLPDGAQVEAFDDAGNIGTGTLAYQGTHEVLVRVARVEPPAEPRGPIWSVASAVPKGERADWMVEKLSELGAAAFIPLATERSIVLPAGRGKRDRWLRIAAESAKQSRRTGVMRVEELTLLSSLLKRLHADGALSGPSDSSPSRGWFLSTAPDAVSAAQAIMREFDSSFILLIGPEGGWTQHEVADMSRVGLTPVGLTTTILRVETAAVAAASIVATLGTQTGGAVGRLAVVCSTTAAEGAKAT